MWCKTLHYYTNGLGMFHRCKLSSICPDIVFGGHRTPLIFLEKFFLLFFYKSGVFSFCKKDFAISLREVEWFLCVRCTITIECTALYVAVSTMETSSKQFLSWNRNRKFSLSYISISSLQKWGLRDCPHNMVVFVFQKMKNFIFKWNMKPFSYRVRLLRGSKKDKVTCSLYA